MAQTWWFGLPSFRWSLSLFGLCVFTFSIVTYFIKAGEIGAAIGIAGLVFQLRTLRAPLPIWLYTAFILWAFVAAYQSPYQSIALENVVEHLKLLAIVLVAVNALRTQGQLRFFLLFFLGCFLLFPVRGTIIGGETMYGRVVWNYIYHNPNDLATLSMITLGVALGFAFSRQSPGIVRLGAALGAVLLLAVMLLTQSRGAFIGLIAGIGPALFWRSLARPARVLTVLAVLAVIIGPLVPPAAWERLLNMEKLTSTSTIAEADPEGSAAERFEIQKVGLQIFLANPTFGIGLGAYPHENARYAPEIGMKDTHNTYLRLLAEVGLPGCILWCALVWSVLRFAYRRRRSSDDDLATQQAWLERALWGYLVAGIFGSYSKLTLPYLMLAVLWAWAALLPQRKPAEKRYRQQ
jgi:O-antigen ligase